MWCCNDPDQKLHAMPVAEVFIIMHSERERLLLHIYRFG